MTTLYKNIMEDILNDRAKEILAYHDEYTKPGTSEVVKKAILAAVRANDKLIVDVFETKTRAELETALKDAKRFHKTKEEICNAIVEYIVKETSADDHKFLVRAAKDHDGIVMIKKVGMSTTAAKEYFGVDDKKVQDLFAKNINTTVEGDGYKYGRVNIQTKEKPCFIEIFVDTFVRKAVNEYLAKNTVKGAKPSLSVVYKVEGRNIYDIDVTYTIKAQDVSKKLCNDIADIFKNIPLFGLN